MLKYTLLVGVLIVINCNVISVGVRLHKDHFLLNKIADQFAPPSIRIMDPGKYYYPKFIARLIKYGEKDVYANEYLNEIAGKGQFHFTMIGFCRLAFLFPNAPVVKNTISLELDNIYNRNDSYNAWTGEGTENHLNMSRTSGYLFAQLMKSLKIKEDYICDSLLELQKKWIVDYSNKVLTLGTAEWNSSTYTGYNLIGWLNLYDFAKDDEVRYIAKKVLDYYALEIKIHYYNGVISGAEMRGAHESLPFKSCTNYFAWYWYGNLSDTTKYSCCNDKQFIQIIHAITSNYIPPSFDSITTNYPCEVIGYKPSYLFESKNTIKQYNYITNNFFMGTAQINYRGFASSNSQIIPAKITLNSHNDVSTITLRGNYFDHGIDPYTRIYQKKNSLIIYKKLPKNYMILDSLFKIKLNKWNYTWKQDLNKRFPNEFFKKDIVKYSRYKPLPGTGIDLLSKEKIIKSKSDNLIIYGNNKLIIKTNATQIKEKRIIKGPLKNHLIYSFSNSNEDMLYVSIEITELYKNDNKSYVKVLDDNRISYNDTILIHNKCLGNIEPIMDWGFNVNKPNSIIESPPYTQPIWDDSDTCEKYNISPPSFIYKIGRKSTYKNGNLVTNQALLR